MAAARPLAEVSPSHINFPNNGVATVPNFAVQNSGSAFTTVSALGATLKATERFDLYVEGRYLKTYGLDAERTFIDGAYGLDAERTFIDGGVSGFNADVDDDPDGLSLTVGTRINF